MAVIRFETSDREIELPEGDDVNLLRFAMRHEVGLPWKCASGLCGTDRVLIVEGAEHLSPPRRREKDRLGDLIDEGVRLACQTYVSGPCTVVWDPDQRGIDEDSEAGKRLKARWLAGEDEG
jgi:ferredoxin